jgi:hypothetical protein
MVLLASWENVSLQLCADLMLYDASAHQKPESFDAWANGGPCPYSGVRVQRAANFIERKEAWGSGKTCRIYDLMVRVLEEKCPAWSEEQIAAFVSETSS